MAPPMQVVQPEVGLPMAQIPPVAQPPPPQEEPTPAPAGPVGVKLMDTDAMMELRNKLRSRAESFSAISRMHKL